MAYLWGKVHTLAGRDAGTWSRFAGAEDHSEGSKTQAEKDLLTFARHGLSTRTLAVGSVCATGLRDSAQAVTKNSLHKENRENEAAVQDFIPPWYIPTDIFQSWHNSASWLAYRYERIKTGPRCQAPNPTKCAALLGLNIRFAVFSRNHRGV